LSKRGWTACGCGLVVLAGILAAYIIVEPMKWSARRASGANDVAGPWYACVQYAAKHEGFLPPLDTEPGRLMFDRAIMHAEYGVTGKTVTMEYDAGAPASWKEYCDNPQLAENRDLINDHSWWYLGYEMKDEQEALLFAKKYLQQVVTTDCFNAGSSTEGLRRLRFPVSQLEKLRAKGYVKDDALARIPVFVERPGHYKHYSGGFVTYLDGHREYIDYPGRFPMTARFIGLLKLLDDVGNVFAS